MKWMFGTIFLSLFVTNFAIEKEDRGTVIGIDLGTTYSCVGVYRDGKVEIFPNDQGKRITPSYVAFTPDGNRLIGDAAKNQLTTNPENTIFDVKRLIGREWSDTDFQKDIGLFPFEVVEGEGKPHVKVKVHRGFTLFSPEEISAMILSKMKEIAETHLGEKITKAVITGTAYFNDAQRQATKDAGVIAGLHVLRIINEPTAAAVAYGFDRQKDDRNVLIFDLGGGTFDVTVLTIDTKSANVLATSGNTHLGGEDFDHRVMRYFIRLYFKKTGINISGNNKAVQKLRREVERAKRRLSYEYEVQLEIDSFYEGQDYKETLTRGMFENLNMDLFKSTIRTIKNVLIQSNLRKEEIDEIVLAGGSTRIPKIQQLVKEFFNGKEPAHGINPDEVVAYGAAIQAGVLSKKYNTEKLLLLVDVNPLSLGLEAASGSMVTMIKKNTNIPCKWAKVFGPAKNDQDGVTIQVYEGEDPIAKNNQLLGIFQFSGIPQARQGSPRVEVTFQMDVNGILKLTVEDKWTGKKEGTAIINVHKRLSDEDIERMTKTAQHFAQKDRKGKERSEARNDLESYVYSLKNWIYDKEKINDRLSVKEKLRVKSVIEEKIEWLELNENAETEDIRYEKEELDYVMNQVMSNLCRSADYDIKKDEL